MIGLRRLRLGYNQSRRSVLSPLASTLRVSATTSTMSFNSHRNVSVAVVGVGLVGSEFVRQLRALPSQHPFRLISLSSSKATVFNPDGIPPSADWRALLRASATTATATGTGTGTGDLVNKLTPLVRDDNAVVFVDNTASASVAELYPALLRAGVHVVTPNKKAFSGPRTLYDQIVAASREGRAKFFHEATVGAGLPVLSTLKDLVATGDKVTRIEGVFSGTLSYIFNEFSTGSADGPSFSTVVRTARDKGYTEPHPADDLNGADVARKLTILTRLLSNPNPDHIPQPPLLPDGYASVPTLSLIPPTLSLSSVPTGDAFLDALQAHDAHFGALRAEAARQGQGGRGAVLRYVGVIDVNPENGSASVKASLEQYPATHPFATSLGGSDNIIMFHTERYGARPLIIQGAGAGAAVTAMGVLSDLLKLA
ncbi:aspartate kinase homoserine dehydrogenase [Russula earlei]|uniref:Aspartate kinase homoserine dehydrogenase n=1 Tax=Russula earlei TaxID=71964 RepID=A0ACC0UCT9_9AGAM|nr:aspartate kinase homoserine dehydrogenase [Russula earlei]